MKHMSNLIILLMIALTSCNSNSSKEKQIDNAETPNNTNTVETLVQQELIVNKEKIYLLSLSSKIHFDTLKLIIKDYYLNEYDILFNKTHSLRDSSIVDYKKSIESISRKYHLSESKVASVLFSFKYEMRTPEQIIEEYKNQQFDYQEYEDQ